MLVSNGLTTIDLISLNDFTWGRRFSSRLKAPESSSRPADRCSRSRFWDLGELEPKSTGLVSRRAQLPASKPDLLTMTIPPAPNQRRRAAMPLASPPSRYSSSLNERLGDLASFQNLCCLLRARFTAYVYYMVSDEWPTDEWPTILPRHLQWPQAFSPTHCRPERARIFDISILIEGEPCGAGISKAGMGLTMAAGCLIGIQSSNAIGAAAT